MIYGIKERSIGLAILFTIITCGIYGLYWLYKLAEESDTVTGRVGGTSPGMVLLFSIITCGIYEVYWCYKQGEKFREYSQRAGSMEADNCPILYLALAVGNYFVGFTTLIAFALMQDRINGIVRSTSAGGTTSNGGSSESFSSSQYTYASPEPEEEPEDVVARETPDSADSEN